MSTHFGFIPLYSKLVKNRAELDKTLKFYFDSLHSIGGKRISLQEKSFPSPIFYFMITGGTENILIDHWNNIKKTEDQNEINLIAHPTHNSLPASLEVLGKYRQENHSGRIFYLDEFKIDQGIEEISKHLDRIKSPEILANKKIGLIGEPSDWLVASSPDSKLIQNVWGPSIIPIQISELEEVYHKIRDGEITNTVNSIIKESKQIVEPKESEISDSVKVYLALKNLVEKYNLDALTIRCFDLLNDINTSGCLALSMLNDEGIIAGCEGDLVSALGMLWIYNLVDEMPWMANPSQIDMENNSLIFAHCTVPRNLVSNYNLRSHFESGLSIGISGEFEKSDVTLVRIGGKDLKSVWMSEGKIIQTGNSEHLCRTQIEIKLIDSSPAELLEQPLGNHTLIIKGSHSTKLRNWWQKNIKH
jgi:L-fucose isomerase-like protein